MKYRSGYDGFLEVCSEHVEKGGAYIRVIYIYTQLGVAKTLERCMNRFFHEKNMNLHKLLCEPVFRQGPTYIYIYIIHLLYVFAYSMSTQILALLGEKEF